MEALASRVGRFESELEAIRRELLLLQGQSQAVPESATQGGEAQRQWVRLFEKDLELLRRQTESFEEPLSVLEHRLARLESVALPESGRDLEDLAELVLSELQDLQAKVRQLQTPQRQGVALHGSQPEPRETSRALRAPGAGEARRGVAGAMARIETIQRLEQSNASMEARLQRLEKEVVPGEGGAQSLQKRLRHLEEEVKIGLQPLKRHQVSLQFLEETSLKVEKLQSTLKMLPIDSQLQRSQEELQALEDAGRGAAGKMSLLDGYKVQNSLEQLYAAVEALVRGRNRDVQLVNSYLREVYQRIERDLPSDKGQSMVKRMDQLQSQQNLMQSETRGIMDVRIPELEMRLSHEASAATALAEGQRLQLTRLELAMQELAEQLTATEARLPALQDASERRGQAEARRESAMAELRTELLGLRQDVAQFTSQGEVGSFGEQFHASLTATQATLMARIEKEAKEKGQSLDSLKTQLQTLQDRLLQAEMAGNSASTFLGDLQMLAQDFASLRQEAARADMELRERVTRGERELKAEIRAAQRLLLEVAEGARHLSPEHLTAVELPAPELPALPGLATAGNGDIQVDAGTLTMQNDAVEWHVPGVRARARLGASPPLISSAFDLDRFPHIKALRLKIFPLGSRRRTKPGHCSVYLTGPEGAHLQFMLRMGTVEHGPLECIFDRPEKDSGRHDFCSLEDELEVDGSAVVRLTVLSADMVKK